MTGALPSKSEPPSPPVHIAIIMDGNGRWAKARGLPRIEGHRKGAGAVRRVVRSAADLGVSYLTIYGFSSENWQRPQAEVRDLMGLLRLYLRSEVAELHRNGVRIRIIGERERLAADINELIDGAEERTKSNTRLNLVIALSYGGRSEIARAARRLAEEVLRGGIRPEEIDARTFERYLATVGVPDPDLVIRTGGELRLSNFLLWQSAYAELIFTERLWPDFDRADLESAIGEFQRRERRYGASSG